MNGRQAGRSCLDYETGTAEVDPAIYTFWREECSTIAGKISFHLCNFNKSDAIELHERRTKLKYNGDEIAIPVESRTIGPNQCKVISIEREWDTCDLNPKKGSKSRPMSAQLSTRNVRTTNGSNGRYNAYCHCKFALKLQSFPMHCIWVATLFQLLINLLCPLPFHNYPQAIHTEDLQLSLWKIGSKPFIVYVYPIVSTEFLANNLREDFAEIPYCYLERYE